LIFGSISYLNLLPFQIFLKKYIKNTQIKQIIFHKKGFPSKINIDFNQKRVDGAFISSIKSRGKNCTDVGIVTKGAVYSVFVISKNSKKRDSESDTSNILREILNLDGEVIIGDKALKLYLDNQDIELVDLSLEWYRRTKLPFVFARLCYNKNGELIKRLSRKFLRDRTKIPYYYLKRASKTLNIPEDKIKWYLSHIDYKISWQEKKSLKLFFKYAKSLRYKSC
jgi:chorismate dehydratase